MRLAHGGSLGITWAGTRAGYSQQKVCGAWTSLGGGLAKPVLPWHSVGMGKGWGTSKEGDAQDRAGGDCK